MTTRRVMTLPLGGKVAGGAKVDEITLPSGALLYRVWGANAQRFFREPVEAFDYALNAMGWNAQVTERYTDS